MRSNTIAGCGLLIALGIGLMGASRAQEAEPVVDPVTVIFVRHAETEASTRQVRDPELSELGRERAQRLRDLLHKAGVTHLFSSQYKRTGATLQPLADALELEVQVVAANDRPAQLKALRALPAGAIAVVAGHSNTVPAMVRDLGGEVADVEEHPSYGPMLAHEDYGRLFLMTLSNHARVGTRTIELRY